MVAIGRAGVDLYSLDYDVPLEKVTKFAKYMGGTAANVVVGCARLGLRSALFTRVSDDELGNFILQRLREEGTETKYVIRDREGKTGVVFAEIYPGKDSKFIFYREKAADLRLRKSDVSNEMIARTKALIVTGTGLSAEPSRSANVYAAKLAKSAGKHVVFNLDYRPSLWKEPDSKRIDAYGRALEFADVVIGNEGEYMAATERKTISQATTGIPDHDSKTLVVTSGQEGVTVLGRGEKNRIEGFRVPYLKGLGGGDGFISGFMYGYLNGWDLAEAAQFGNAVGAIVVMGHSCSESMPSLEQVKGFLSEKKLKVPN